MAYTAAGLVSRVQTRIRDTGFSSSTILDLLNETLFDIFNEYPSLPFMQTHTDYSLVANVADITNGAGLPTNYGQTLNLELRSTGLEKRIPFLTYRQIEERYPDASDTTAYPANVPEVAYFADGTINVHPVPNSTYSVRLTYFKNPTELANDSDIPDLPTEFGEMLVLGAAYRALQIKDNYDQAGVLQNKFDEILQKLVVKYSQVQTGTPARMRVNRRAVGKTNF